MIGFSVGQIGKFLFSNVTIASLQLWYVMPEYRTRTRAAFELLHTFENWAKLSGVYRIEVGGAKISAEEAENANRIFAKRGYTLYGKLLFKDM